MRLNKRNSTRGRLTFVTLLCALVLSGLVNTVLVVAAQDFADPAFSNVWNRTDKQVASGSLSRTFLWGPEPFTTGQQEDYAEAPGGKRLVQYFDKSRMEITNPNGDKTSAYFVTNGLLARELMSGQLQLGDSKFETRESAAIGVAGDSDDTSGPTYKVLNGLTLAAGDVTGSQAVKAIDRAGNIRDGSAEFGKYNVTYAKFEATTSHNIATPFWTFLNQTGPVLGPNNQLVQGRLFDPVYYATGLPITDGWWAKVKVGGQLKDVLVQAFERRILTYTPSNDAAFQVEMGNVGRHYYNWRYNTVKPPVATPVPTVTPTPAPVQNACDKVPEPKNARVRPAKCVLAGFIVRMDIYGFKPNEQVGFWLTDPNDRVVGTTQTVGIGPAGAVNNLGFDTYGLQKGLWYWVFQGASSGHQSIVYILIE